MKKITKLLFSLILSFSCTQTVITADESIENGKIIDLSDYEITEECINIPIEDQEYIKTRSGKILKLSELPSFSSIEEVENYYSTLTPIQTLVPRDSQGSQLVDSYTFDVNNINSINLYVSYTTSGNNYTGEITSHRAYTVMNDVTGTYEYEEEIVWSQVTTSGKDIMAESAGTLIKYFLFNGSLQLSSEYVKLHGTAFAVK